MENIVRDGAGGSVEVIRRSRRFKRGSYLMNQDASALKVKEIGQVRALILRRRETRSHAWRCRPLRSGHVPGPCNNRSRNGA